MNTAKKSWVSPKETLEEFTPNEYVSACYKIACKAGTQAVPSNGFQWDGYEHAGATHAESGAGTCADSTANRIITDTGIDSKVGEYNSEQGWLDGSIDKIIDNGDNKVGPGDLVYWHTSGTENRRWNHWGIIEEADSSRPNHS